MSSKLTDTQRDLLSAAAQREDRLLAIPPQLKGGAAQKVAAKLIGNGLVKQIKAKTGAPIWRQESKTEQAYSLRLTAVGLKAGSVDEKEHGETATANSSESATQTHIAPGKGGARPGPGGALVTPLRPPRGGSKLDRIVGMLAAEKGATLEDLTGATGWLPHTARAALTGLRKRGYDVRLSRSDKKSAAVYRVTAPARGGSR